MARLHEDPQTRRVVDTGSPAYRVGVAAANKIIAHEYAKVPMYQLDVEVMMSDLLKLDPDVTDDWGIYLVLKGMLDTFGDYRPERST
jgi:hypothetical protein